MQTDAEPRVRKRLPCTLSVEARRHNGMILNLSSRGLFVQTTLPAEPGTLLDLDVRDPDRGAPIPLQAAVVWRRRVSPRMTGLNQSGMGLRLLNHPPAWQTMMSGLLGAEVAGADAAAEPGATVSTPTRADGADATRTAAAAPKSPPAAAPAATGIAFVVRLAQTGGPRSRRIRLRCASETDAAAEALRVAGDGWTLLEVRRD